MGLVSLSSSQPCPIGSHTILLLGETCQQITSFLFQTRRPFLAFHRCKDCPDRNNCNNNETNCNPSKPLKTPIRPWHDRQIQSHNADKTYLVDLEPLTTCQYFRPDVLSWHKTAVNFPQIAIIARNTTIATIALVATFSEFLKTQWDPGMTDQYNQSCITVMVFYSIYTKHFTLQLFHV